MPTNGVLNDAMLINMINVLPTLRCYNHFMYLGRARSEAPGESKTLEHFTTLLDDIKDDHIHTHTHTVVALCLRHVR